MCLHHINNNSRESTLKIIPSEINLKLQYFHGIHTKEAIAHCTAKEIIKM